MIKKILLASSIVAVMGIACTSGRPPYTCDDPDGDGFGEGPECLGSDCAEGDPSCHEGKCCQACDDPDGDGYGQGGGCEGLDCNEDDPECHAGDCCDPCPDGQVRCGGECVDTGSDTAHCGTCYAACDATEICADGNCSCPDADADGFDICDPSAEHDNDWRPADCDDGNAEINPAQDEICGNATDEDCSGDINDLDADSDSYLAEVDAEGNACGGSDCDDGNEAINPGVAEECNGIDDDCDDLTDEHSDETCYDGPAGTAGSGICREGTRYCIEGSLGNCVGQVRPSPEACNGLDDDCDDLTDEDTAVLTCGVGECRVSVPSCDNGVPQQCVPGSAVGAEICGDGLDNDCNGHIDDGCNCIHVAPFGDDNNGTGTEANPVQTINAGILLAQNPGSPKTVCVAAQSNCHWTFYDESVAMADGISVAGGFDPNTSPWTQRPLHVNSPSCVTEIRGQTTWGLYFGSGVTSPTLLDNFALSLTSDLGPDTAVVTIKGSSGAEIGNCSVFGSDTGSSSVGVLIVEDTTGSDPVPASPVIFSSTIEGGAASTSIGIYSVNSSPVILSCCSPADITAGGRCLHGCIDGIHIRANRFVGGGVQLPDIGYAVLLENSPGAAIDQSAVCASAVTEAAGIKIIGDATGSVISRNDTTVWGADDDNGIAAIDCAGSSPWIGDNERIAAEGNSSGTARVNAILAAGDCHPLIEANRLIVGGMEGTTEETRGVSCARSPLSGVASQCSIVGNEEIRGSNNKFPTDSIGVLCADGSCNQIRDNRLIHGNRGINVIGVKLLGDTNAVVDGNRIEGGCCQGFAAGVLSENSSARIQNNSIYGGTCTGGSVSGLHFFGLLSLLARGMNELDVHSNWIHGGGTAGGACDSSGVSIDLLFGANPPIPPRGILRNNIIESGDCSACWAVEERDTAADPRIVENNDLLCHCSETLLYLDDLYTALDLAGVNGLTDIQSAGGNISEDPQAIYLVGGFLHLGQSSPCRNQGTAAGAPGWDFEGDPRPAEDAPDIGPDEYVP